MAGDSGTRHVLTILAVEDLPRSDAFYRAAFGWPPAVEAPVYVEYALPRGQRLGLYERNGFGKNTGQVPVMLEAGALAPTELYFYPPNLPEALARLESAGARSLSPLAARPWGDEVAYFADPSGNVIALATPILDEHIQERTEGDGALCRDILEALPDWFGLPDAIERYAREAPRLPMLTIAAEGRAAGFVSLKRHLDTTCEIYVMGVRPELHRRGLGRKLLQAAESLARRQGCELMTVKTLSPSRESAEYAATRKFYLAMGFRPLEELPTLWDENNPCLLMVKTVS